MTIEQLGKAILASDRSVAAITDIMRGVGYGVFASMDRRDGWGGVPEWHPYLRRWRNARPDFLAILNGE